MSLTELTGFKLRLYLRSAKQLKTWKQKKNMYWSRSSSSLMCCSCQCACELKTVRDTTVLLFTLIWGKQSKNKLLSVFKVDRLTSEEWLQFVNVRRSQINGRRLLKFPTAWTSARREENVRNKMTLEKNSALIKDALKCVVHKVALKEQKTGSKRDK